MGKGSWAKPSMSVMLPVTSPCENLKPECIYLVTITDGLEHAISNTMAGTHQADRLPDGSY